VETSELWLCFSPHPVQTGNQFIKLLNERGVSMDSTTIIRIVAGVLFVIVLVILIQRRRTRVK